MDWLTFVVRLVETLTWPFVLLTIVLIFRRPLRQLISGTKRVKYQDLEIEFVRELSKVQTEALKVLPQPGESLLVEEISGIETEATRVDRPGGFHLLAKASTSGAVRVAWKEIECALQGAARRVGLADSETAEEALKQLKARKVVTGDEARLISRLKALGDAASHLGHRGLLVEDALQYRRIADAVVGRLGAVGATEG